MEKSKEKTMKKSTQQKRHRANDRAGPAVEYRNRIWPGTCNIGVQGVCCKTAVAFAQIRY